MRQSFGNRFFVVNATSPADILGGKSPELKLMCCGKYGTVGNFAYDLEMETRTIHGYHETFYPIYVSKTLCEVMKSKYNHELSKEYVPIFNLPTDDIVEAELMYLNLLSYLVDSICGKVLELKEELL